jgi:hypothetical protein
LTNTERGSDSLPLRGSLEQGGREPLPLSADRLKKSLLLPLCLSLLVKYSPPPPPYTQTATTLLTPALPLPSGPASHPLQVLCVHLTLQVLLCSFFSLQDCSFLSRTCRSEPPPPPMRAPRALAPWLLAASWRLTCGGRDCAWLQRIHRRHISIAEMLKSTLRTLVEQSEEHTVRNPVQRIFLIISKRPTNSGCHTSRFPIHH